MYYDQITEFVFQEDQPERADYIFIPGSGYGELAYKAADLYLSGYAQKIIVSGKFSILDQYFKGAVSPKEYCDRKYETESDFLKAVLLEKGVKEQDIMQEKQASFTYENAIYTRILLEGNNKQKNEMPKKVLLVCQAFHGARAGMYFRYVFPETKFLICPVVTQGISRTNWMNQEKGRDIVLGEVERIGKQFQDLMNGRDQAEEKCRKKAAAIKAAADAQIRNKPE